MPEACRDVPEVFVFQSIAKPALHGHEHERVMMAVRQGLQDADDRRQEAMASPRVTGWVTLTGPDTFQLRDTGGTTFNGSVAGDGRFSATAVFGPDAGGQDVHAAARGDIHVRRRFHGSARRHPDPAQLRVRTHVDGHPLELMSLPARRRCSRFAVR